jgi:YggT family protein
MLFEALTLIIHAIFGFFAFVLLLRFWMQWARVATRNPLSAFVQSLTNFIVMPARHFIPGLWGHDLATLVLAWVTIVIELLIIALLRSAFTGMPIAIGGVLIMAVLMLVRLMIFLVIGAILLQVVLSWVNPSSPIAPVVHALTAPLLRPIQRVVPTIGMVDLSPLIALVLLQLLLIPLDYLARGLGAGVAGL